MQFYEAFGSFKADLHWTIFLAIALKIRSEKAVLISSCVAFVTNTRAKSVPVPSAERGWRNSVIPLAKQLIEQNCQEKLKPLLLFIQ